MKMKWNININVYYILWIFSGVHYYYWNYWRMTIVSEMANGYSNDYWNGIIIEYGNEK